MAKQVETPDAKNVKEPKGKSGAKPKPPQPKGPVKKGVGPAEVKDPKS